MVSHYASYSHFFFSIQCMNAHVYTAITNQLNNETQKHNLVPTSQSEGAPCSSSTQQLL